MQETQPGKDSGILLIEHRCYPLYSPRKFTQKLLSMLSFMSSTSGTQRPPSFIINSQAKLTSIEVVRHQTFGQLSSRPYS